MMRSEFQGRGEDRKRVALIRRARTNSSPSASWVRALLERRAARVVTVAMANKTARIAWAVLARQEVYHEPVMA